MKSEGQFSQAAIDLGSVQVAYEAQFKNVEATRLERVSFLLKTCAKFQVSLKGYDYLENYLGLGA